MSRPPAPPTPMTQRFGVAVNADETGAFIEVFDNLAMARIRYPLLDALQIAALINQAVVRVMVDSARQAQHQRNSIVRVN